jgi:hypothetical protein
MQSGTSSAFDTGFRDPWYGQDFWAVPDQNFPRQVVRPNMGVTTKQGNGRSSSFLSTPEE